MTSSRYQENWRRLLHPRAVALVGASDNNISAKYVHENMRRAGFVGEIHPVNPRGAPVFGTASFASISDVPAADVAVILLARERVEESVAQAIGRGVGGIIVVAGGFRETREQAWIEAEARIVAAAKAAEVPLIGPNCLGLIALPSGAMMTIANYPWPLRQGSVALVMQSGGQLLASCRYVNYIGGGVRWGFSLGNGTTVSFAETVSILAEDPAVGEIVLLVEEISDWPKFRKAVEVARRAGKWIAALVIGMTDRGQRAAATHTGAVAVDHEILSSGLAQLGVRVGETLNATLSAAVLHARFGDPRRGAIGIAGVSGGGSGLAGDLAAGRGVELAVLSEQTTAAIQAINPQVQADNPIDIVGGPLERERFRAVFEAFLRDPNIAATLYLPSQGVPEDSLPGHVATLESVADAADQVGAPVVISSVVYAAIPEEPHARLLQRANVCVLPTIEDALAAFSVWQLAPQELIELNRRRFQPFSTSNSVPGAEQNSQPLDEAGIKAILAEHGCRVPYATLLDVAAARALEQGHGAAAIGFPVVVKGIGRDIFHKAELGLVKTGIRDQAEFAQAVQAVLHAAGAAKVENVLVEQQVEAGADMMVSVVARRLGTVIVIGEGGGEAGQAGKTNWIAIDPTDADLLEGAHYILGKLGMAGPAEAVADFARRLAMIHRAKGFDLLEINPARLLASGEIYALDAVATLNREAGLR